jgi:hypothetical protein
MDKLLRLFVKLRNASVPVLGEATLMFSTVTFLSDDENAMENATDVKIELAPPKECPVTNKR